MPKTKPTVGARIIARTGKANASRYSRPAPVECVIVRDHYFTWPDTARRWTPDREVSLIAKAGGSYLAVRPVDAPATKVLVVVRRATTTYSSLRPHVTRHLLDTVDEVARTIAEEREAHQTALTRANNPDNAPEFSHEVDEAFEWFLLAAQSGVLSEDVDDWHLQRWLQAEREWLSENERIGKIGVTRRRLDESLTQLEGLPDGPLHRVLLGIMPTITKYGSLRAPSWPEIEPEDVLAAISELTGPPALTHEEEAEEAMRRA